MDVSVVLAGILSLAFSPSFGAGQSLPSRDGPGDTTLVAPGASYATSSLGRWLLGSGYRELWTTPMAVEVADLSRLGDGLTPMRVGGGATTATLHLRGGDGRRYVFRSVDKRAGRGLAAEFQGTIYESILQDQISAFHPSGALIVARLLDAVGVLHTQPRLYIIPDDPVLGEFQAEFGGTLALFEERPDDSEVARASFAGARRVINSERLFARLRESPRQRVDAREFLVARLVDLVVGDRDRSPNNWLWAQFPAGDSFRWRPIPRDRDQAFIRLDGVLKQWLRVYESRLSSFGPVYSSIDGLTRSAWDLDRTILVSVPSTAWDSAVAFVQNRLSDSVIDSAVAAMPAEHTRLVGARIATALRRRREALPEAADRLYSIVARFADVVATDHAEYAVVTREPDGSVTVSLTDFNDVEAYFLRTFSPDETSEVRLYLLDGDDRLLVHGGGTPDIMVRAVGGGGVDSFTDSTLTGRRVRLYDGGARTGFLTQAGAAVIRSDSPRPRMWGERAALPPDWGRSWAPFPMLGARGDVGAILGARVTLTNYGFGKPSFANQTVVEAEVAAGVGRGRGEFLRHWRVSESLSTRLRLAASGLEVIRFYGFGNVSPDSQPNAFYRAIHDDYSATASASLTPGNRWSIAIRLIFRHAETDTSDTDTFVSLNRPYGSGGFSHAGSDLTVAFDSRDRVVGATRGVHVTATTALYPAVFSVTEPFGVVGGTASGYLAADKTGRLVLAARVGAKKTWGRTPFHEAVFLGGPNDVRGFRRQRYAGDAAVFGNAELRLLLSRVQFMFPTDVGLLGSADAGRVFVAGESPGGWHQSFGGGFWLAPVDRVYTASVLLAQSASFRGLYVRSGFLF